MDINDKVQLILDKAQADIKALLNAEGAKFEMHEGLYNDFIQYTFLAFDIDGDEYMLTYNVVMTNEEDDC